MIKLYKWIWENQCHSEYHTVSDEWIICLSITSLINWWKNVWEWKSGWGDDSGVSMMNISDLMRQSGMYHHRHWQNGNWSEWEMRKWYFALWKESFIRMYNVCWTKRLFCEFVVNICHPKERLFALMCERNLDTVMKHFDFMITIILMVQLWHAACVWMVRSFEWGAI